MPVSAGRRQTLLDVRGDRMADLVRPRVPRLSSNCWRAALTAVMAIFTPSSGVACPLCLAAAGERVVQTYLFSAAIMSLMPLLIVTVIGVWLRKRLRAQNEEEPTAAVGLLGDRG